MSSVEYNSHTPKFAGKASDIVSVLLVNSSKMLYLSGVAAECPDGEWLKANMAPAANIAEQVAFVWQRIGELVGYCHSLGRLPCPGD